MGCPDTRKEKQKVRINRLNKSCRRPLKNNGFSQLTQMKDDYTGNSHYLNHTFPLKKRLGECVLFEMDYLHAVLFILLCTQRDSELIALYMYCTVKFSAKT